MPDEGEDDEGDDSDDGAEDKKGMRGNVTRFAGSRAAHVIFSLMSLNCRLSDLVRIR